MYGVIGILSGIFNRVLAFCGKNEGRGEKQFVRKWEALFLLPVRDLGGT